MRRLKLRSLVTKADIEAEAVEIEDTNDITTSEQLFCKPV
jgi:hypothetical protein